MDDIRAFLVTIIRAILERIGSTMFMTFIYKAPVPVFNISGSTTVIYKGKISALIALLTAVTTVT